MNGKKEGRMEEKTGTKKGRKDRLKEGRNKKTRRKGGRKVGRTDGRKEKRKKETGPDWTSGRASSGPRAACLTPLVYRKHSCCLYPNPKCKRKLVLTI